MKDLTRQIREKYNLPIAGAYVYYYRDEDRRPIGCVVGVYGAGKIGIGYSYYHESVEKKAGHPLDKKLGRNIALGRAVKEWVLGKSIYSRTAPQVLTGKIQVAQLRCLESLASIKSITHDPVIEAAKAMVKGAFSWRM